MKTITSHLGLGILLVSFCALPSMSFASNADDIRARVKKLGTVELNQAAAQADATVQAAPTAAPKKVTAADGASMYQASCFACHGTGAAGAPILGDQAAWAARIALGEATLVNNAINGSGGMPPRGGSSLDDASIKLIVSYMIEKSQ